ncbi:MAG: PspC domain-containing protein [Woeseiaceae bacterium]|nr:PspC domain-containing protein [Woeseiaceae bacterium]
MSRYEDLPNRRFYRNSERGMIAGVCAGVADYFGFNLCATRALTFIMFLMFMPVTILAYIGCVLLVPGGDRACPPGATP